MTLPLKKWVFTELVKDSDDPEQLLAYAMYKAHKDDLAGQCRARNMAPPKIDAELISFHDGVAHSALRLADYRDKAQRMIADVVSSVEIATAARYQQQIQTINTIHQQALAEAVEIAHKNWIAKVDTYIAVNKSEPWWKKWLMTIVKYLGGAAAGTFGGAILTCLIVGVASWFMPDSRAIVRNGLIEIVNIILPENLLGVGLEGTLTDKPGLDEVNPSTVN